MINSACCFSIKGNLKILSKNSLKPQTHDQQILANFRGTCDNILLDKKGNVTINELKKINYLIFAVNNQINISSFLQSI